MSTDMGMFVAVSLWAAGMLAAVAWLETRRKFWAGMAIAELEKRHEIEALLRDYVRRFEAPSGPASDLGSSDSPEDFRNVLSLDQYRFDADRVRSAPERASLDRWSRDW